MTPGKTFQNLPPEKQKRITRIAAEEFGEKGFDGASVNAMIERMGIAKGSIFQYFGDKKGLFLFVFNQSVEMDMVEMICRGIGITGIQKPEPRSYSNPNWNYYILVIAAVDNELAGLHARLADPVFESFGGKNAASGNLHGRKVMLLATGPGMINAAHALTAVIESRRPALIVQTGCAGAFRQSGLDIGDVAVATKEMDIQSGLEPADDSLFPDNLPFAVLKKEATEYKNHYPVTDHLAVEAFEIIQTVAALSDFHVSKGPFVTVSTITTTDHRAKALFDRFGPCMEQMEGAAAAHIALIYDIPFVEIRAAGNMVGNRDKRAWNLTLAFQNACIAVEAVIRKLKIEN